MIMNKQIRNSAWQALRGKWNAFYPIMLFSLAFADAFGLKIIYQNFFSTYTDVPLSLFGSQLTMTVAVPTGIGIAMAVIALLFMLFGMAVTVGEYLIAANVMNGEQLKLRTLFPGKLLFKAVIMNLLQYIMIMAGTMCFIVPGIIFACNYSMANYLLAQDPELGPVEALTLSRERMRGKRMEYFSLQVSFVPWALLVYLVLYIVSGLIYDLTWPGDIIYTLVSWAASAFLLGYMRVSDYVFFKLKEKQPEQASGYTSDTENDNSRKAREDAQREAEERRQKESDAETIYLRYSCSHNKINRAGMTEQYKALGLSAYREGNLRTEYGRRLMLDFDTDPNVIGDLLELIGEYAMDGLLDRVIARIYRYDREGNIDPETVLVMAKRILEMLHSGAFSEDPGYAARKQADILSLTDSVKRKYEETDPDGAWRWPYREICEICGIDE